MSTTAASEALVVTHACTVPAYEGADSREWMTFALLSDGSAILYDYIHRKPAFAKLDSTQRAEVAALSSEQEVSATEFHVAKHGGMARVLPVAEDFGGESN